MNIHIDELLKNGMQAAREGRWDEARGMFFDVVAQDPGVFEVWLWLGAIAADPKDSVTYLRQALLINPNSIRAQKGMEWAEERLGTAAAPEEPQEERETASAASSIAAEDAELEAEPFDSAPLSSLDEGSSATLSGEDYRKLSPSFSEAAQVSSNGAASGPSTVEPSFDATTDQELGWKEGYIFPDMSLSPLKVDDVDISSQPAISETESLDISETTPAAASNFEAEALPLADSPPASSLSDGDQLPPSFDSIPSTVDWGAAHIPPTVYTEPEDTKDASRPTESWEAIIARLRALDEQFNVEENGVQREETPAEAVASDAELAEDRFPQPLDLPATMDEGQAFSPVQSGDLPDESESALESRPVTASFGESPAAMVEKGKQELDEGRESEAIRSFRRALEMDPELVEAYEQLGVAEYQVGNLERALEAFEKVVRLKPDHAEAHANLGFLFSELGRTESAIAAFHEALRRNGELVEAHMSLAELYKSQGKIDEAVDALSKAAQLRPDLPDVHVNLGEIYAERHLISEAIWEFRLVVDYKPDDAHAHLRLGQLLFQVGRSLDAQREFNESLRLNPNLAEAHYGLASCAEEQDNLDEAVVELERSLAIKPDYLEADERLERLRATLAARNKPESEEVKEEHEKKSRWSFFKRDKK